MSSVASSFKLKQSHLQGIREEKETRAVACLAFLVLLSLSCFGGDTGCEAQELVDAEVSALKQIGLKLKKQWDFSVDPCSGNAGWVVPSTDVYLGNSLRCSCNTTVCHVTTIQFKGQNLTGILPSELASLPYLTLIDFDRNYLKGSIPAAWASLPLTNLSLRGNPISGRIPEELRNMFTLKSLVLEDCQLGGPIPASLGKLTNLNQLILSGNNFSGELPEFLGNLKDMSDIDLSFNCLSGPIPSNFDRLQSTIYFMFLNNNMLQGAIPDWIHRSKDYLDLSYNNFTGSPAPPSCHQGNVNFVSSYSSTDSNSIAPCLRRNIPCSGKARNYDLFINCGGNALTVGDDQYEDDSSALGPATYTESGKWAYSSTGSFLGNIIRAKYIAQNVSTLNMSNPELYMRARLSPLYLSYYGLCLQKGNYTVKLHFAEIMFTDDQTFASLGRRIFDVSVQVLKDFNIAKEANGMSKEIIKTFTTYIDGTLEIHLQWARKGTMSLPRRAVYGPLISSISVTPNFKPDTGDNILSASAILGIVAAACAVIFFIVIWVCFTRKNANDNELRRLELHTRTFSLKQIKAATNNFDPANKIGEGGFGPVYKGSLPDGLMIAVKQLSSKSKQGNCEFVNEIGMISALQHPNLVKLYGCCIERNQLLLIYVYMENNSLARALFGPERSHLKLDWYTRRNICMGIARGLAYLHEDSRLKIVHRDIKATNILLDKNLNAKISDFGLAKLNEEENTHISTRIAGTRGYIVPEYATRGYLTDKADVYSFGIVMLEIVCRESNTNFRAKEESMYLLDWAYILEEQRKLSELVDPRLVSDCSDDDAMNMLNLALTCTNQSPSLRPSMSMVVSILEGKTPIEAPSTNPADSRNKEISSKYCENFSHSHDEEIHSLLTDGQRTESSVTVKS